MGKVDILEKKTKVGQILAADLMMKMMIAIEIVLDQGFLDQMMMMESSAVDTKRTFVTMKKKRSAKKNEQKLLKRKMHRGDLSADAYGLQTLLESSKD